MTDRTWKPGRSECRTLVIGCGALVNELLATVEQHDLPGVDVECLPAKLHNRPALIVGELLKRLDRLASEGRTYERLVIGYADCGTVGGIDRLCEELRANPCEALSGSEVVRLPGAHCYEFFATRGVFAELADAEPATFYLTDFLARHFDTLVWKGLGIAAHPELADMYFGNYRRLLLLTQTPDSDERTRLQERAQAAAQRLGLPLEVRETGYGELADTLVAVAAPGGSRPKGPRSHRPVSDCGAPVAVAAPISRSHLPAPGDSGSTVVAARRGVSTL